MHPCFVVLPLPLQATRHNPGSNNRVCPNCLCTETSVWERHHHCKRNIFSLFDFPLPPPLFLLRLANPGYISLRPQAHSPTIYNSKRGCFEFLLTNPTHEGSQWYPGKMGRLPSRVFHGVIYMPSGIGLSSEKLLARLLLIRPNQSVCLVLRDSASS